MRMPKVNAKTAKTYQIIDLLFHNKKNYGKSDIKKKQSTLHWFLLHEYQWI